MVGKFSLQVQVQAHKELDESWFRTMLFYTTNNNRLAEKVTIKTVSSHFCVNITEAGIQKLCQ